MSFSTGPQGGRALSSPSYNINAVSQTYNEEELSSGSVFIKRVTGPQRIIMELEEGGFHYTWSFSIKGGTNRPTTNSLPMFPNKAKTYTPSINYTLDPLAIEPLGCTVQTQPIPEDKKSSRINIFDITEILSGSSYTFRLRACPFLNIDNSIEVLGPALPIGSVIKVRIEFFRSPPNLRTFGVPISFESPVYKTLAFETPISPIAGVSPLDNPTSKIPFYRFSGQQTITFINYNTGYYFHFDIDYGIIGQAGGYLGYVSPTQNAKTVQGSTPVGCILSGLEGSVVNRNSVIKPITYQATTDISDGGGRVYNFTFYPSPNTNPTVCMVSGTAIGNEEVSIRIYGRYFYSV